MPQYSGLHELRTVLTADDPDTRASAYGAVIGADQKVSDVLAEQPPEETVSALVESGVIEDRSGEDRPPASELRQEMLEVLKQIEKNTGGN